MKDDDLNKLSDDVRLDIRLNMMRKIPHTHGI